LKIGIDASILEGTRTGVARYLKNILKCWAEDFPEHTYVLYFKNSIPEDSIVKNPVFQCKVSKASDLFKRGIIWQLYTIGVLARNDNLDIFYSPAYLLPLTKLKGKKAVGIWDIYFYVHPNFGSLRTRIYNRIFSKFTASQAGIIFTPSLFDKNEIIKYFKVDPNKVWVTPLAPESKFTPLGDAGKGESFRNKYNFKHKYFLYVGLIINRRFQDVVIKAFQEFLRLNPNEEIGLVIVGPNRTYPFIDIKALIDRFNPQNAIKYIEYFPEDEMVSLYACAYASIYLSSYEGEGIPLKEAMACGLPVITSRVLKEMIGEDEAGYLVNDPASEDELLKVFNSLLNDEVKRAAIIKKSLLQVKKFTWKACARETIQVFYEEAAKRA